MTSATNAGVEQIACRNRLRIAFVSAGSFSHLAAYLRYFAGRGHDVHLIAFTPYTLGDAFGATVHDVSTGANPKGPRWGKWRYLLAAPRIRRVLESLQPDVVQGFFATSGGVLCLLSGWRSYIISARGSDLAGSVDSKVWRSILRLVLARASSVHTVSDWLSELAMELGVPDGKIITLTQGVDTTLFRYREPKPLSSPVRLLCTRGLSEVYDPMTVLSATAILERRDVPIELTFAASGPLSAQVRARVEELGLAEAVTLLGGYSNDELPDLMAAHDIYVSASRWDGTSISLLEAMASGLFPVVSRNPSNDVWLKAGETALMFDPGDAEGLADAVLRIIQDEAFRYEVPPINRRAIERRADRSQSMATLEARYLEIAG